MISEREQYGELFDFAENLIKSPVGYMQDQFNTLTDDERVIVISYLSSLKEGFPLSITILNAELRKLIQINNIHRSRFNISSRNDVVDRILFINEKVPGNSLDDRRRLFFEFIRQISICIYKLQKNDISEAYERLIVVFALLKRTPSVIVDNGFLASLLSYFLDTTHYISILRDNIIKNGRTTKRLPYTIYLNTFEWKKVRERKLEQAHHQCQKCSCKKNLEVHHLTYDRVGNEWDSDLIVLCKFCHKEYHGLPKWDD